MATDWERLLTKFEPQSLVPFMIHYSAVTVISLVKNDCDLGQVICLTLESPCDPYIRTSSFIILTQDTE